MKKWKQVKSHLVFDTKYFKVRKDLVELPSKETLEWFYWDSNDSVMVLGMTKDRKLVMVRHYKYLVGDDVLEFPAGGLNKGEGIEAGAKREFEEETGYTCNNLVKLGSFYETYSQLNRQIHIFFSNDLKKSRQNLDQGEKGFEDMKVELVMFDKAVQLALDNKIVAMGCSLAILLLKEKIEDGTIILT